MTAAVRPRRSILYMPGSNARALEKAKGLPADGFIFDLEDAVAPDAKELAREQVYAAAESGAYGGRELVIRANGLDTPWGRDDLAAAAQAAPDAVLIPKVDGPDDIRAAEDILAAAGAPDTTAVWAMMETPRGMLHADAIAASSPRLACLVVGTADLVKDLRAEHTADRLPVLPSLGLCVLAARAHGLAVLDGVFIQLDDMDGFTAECGQGRELGFDGKTLVHPKQIAAANEAFAPGREAVDHARRMIAAYAEAEAQGRGVAVLDGRMVEKLHVENAQRLVALAEAIDALAAE